MREHYGDVEPSDNGVGRPVARPPERRGLRRRSVIVAVSVAVFFFVIGARKCKTHEPATEAEIEQLRIDVVTACRINNCTPQQLRMLLDQADAMPRVEKGRR